MLVPGKQKVLVVDDSSTNVVLLDAILNNAGYEVITSLSAKEGLKYITSMDPDLVLLDLLMPEVSGFDFMKTYNEMNKKRKIPVIVVSAVGTPENKKLSKELGAVSFINKPVDIPELLNLIKQTL
ncbi:MAG: response regulator [Bacteroidetes bacterium]|nr:MAG: response regulator [Bacteroidota bacterium]